MRAIALVGALLSGAVIVAMATVSKTPIPAPGSVRPYALDAGPPWGREPVQPILGASPSGERVDARITLGRRLFLEKKLSEDSSISCGSCHDLAGNGADQRATALGVHGRSGTVNTPTVFNAGSNPHQFWDGRAESLEMQVDGPLENPAELASSWPLVLSRLAEDASYRDAFSVAYADGRIDKEHVRDAIATFERTLITSENRFDRYLRGDANAIDQSEKLGYERFKSYGCVSCHQGRNVGGNLYERLGIMGDYFADRGGPLANSDYGRYNVTKREEDKFRFRVPSLRVAGTTAPYFHDGRVATLEDAIVAMGKYQLGETIRPEDVGPIAAFIRSLGGTP